METRHLFKLSLLALSIYSHFGSASELNLDFIQGTSVIPSVLKSDSAYPAGQYAVDVLINNEPSGRANLIITEEDEKNNRLCLSPEWLDNAGVMFKEGTYDDAFDKEKQCYVLTQNPHTKVDFDFGTQALKFNIPQAYLLSKTDPARWDYGVNGGRLKYYGNFNKNVHDDVTAFGNFDAAINLGRWVLSSNMNVSHDRNKTEFTSSDLTLSTAISQVQGDLLLGKSQTRTELFSDFNFYGAALRSNSNMRPWESRGYAPDISGIASTPSRITVKQNGYTVYSKMVPAGPYRLDDLRPMGNGDLEVTVEDESGNKSVQTYPVTTLPTLLRPGEFQYNVAVGKKNDRNELDKAFHSDTGPFWLGSLDYGFSTTTLNSAFIVNNDYQSGGLGVTQMLGEVGALSLSANVARASYDTRTGGTTFNTTVSAMPTDRLNYSLSANAGSKGDRGATASASYAFDAAQTNMSIPLFVATQINRSIKTEASIRQVFIEAGVSERDYDAAKNSMAVRVLTAKQQEAAKSYGVTGTPSFFVNGRYLVNNGAIKPSSEQHYGKSFADVVSALLKHQK